MQVLTTIDGMRGALRQLRASGSAPLILGLVPTMGALHPGHLSLVKAAKLQCDLVAVSIFVNPLQFGAGEDFDEYPRMFDCDRQHLIEEGVDLLFIPDIAEMYPRGAATIVEVEGIGDQLDGASRPGHFRGVATVVAKLFHIVQPDVAFFGQKDAAQVAVLRSMVRDLNFGLHIVVCPTVREPDGLAMSSRNRYLTADQRRHALTLSTALSAAQTLVQAGEICADRLREAMLHAFLQQPEVHLDYAAVVDPVTLEPLSDIRSGALVAVAATLGATRLIDNIVIPPGGQH